MTSCCRFDKGTLLSARWLRPRVTVLFCHSPYFYSFLSFHGLTGKSLDCRIKSGNDKKKNKSDNDNYLSVIPVLDTGIYKRYSGQARI